MFEIALLRGAQKGSSVPVPRVVRPLFVFWAIAVAAFALKLPPFQFSWPFLLFALAATGLLLTSRLRPVLRIACALVLSIAARIYVDRATPYLMYDPSSYLLLANHLAAGRGLTVDALWYGAGLKATYPPLYPILLAAAQGQYVALNAAIDCVAAAAILRLTGSARAAAAYLLVPTTILFGAAPWKEGLAVAIVLWGPLLSSPYLFGALCAAAALTQPAFAPLLPLYWLLQRHGWAANLKAAATAVVGMAPWWIRNWLVLGHFVPLTTSAGLSFSVAVNKFHWPTEHLPMGEVERAAFSARRSWAIMMADPMRYLIYIVKVFVSAFLSESNAASLLVATESKIARASLWLSQVALMLVVAMAALARTIDQRVLHLSVGFAGCCLLSIWLEFSTRHRIIVVPLLMILIANGVKRPKCVSRGFLRLSH